MTADLYGPWDVAGYSVRVDFSRGARLVAARDGNDLRQLPSAVRESADLAWMRLCLEAAKDHFRNLRSLVEGTLIESQDLSPEDVAMLALDPVGRSVLGRLVVRMDGIVGRPLPEEWLLEGLNADFYRLTPPFRLVHPLELESAGTIEAWDRWLNRQPFEQPFKQLRRERFSLSDAERGATYSARWEGEEVRWDQTRVLLEGRGWQRVTKSGALRMYPRARMAAHLEFRTLAARSFDREHVVLNRLFFLPLGELPNNKERPGVLLTQVERILFSETLRDVGLIAQVAGVPRTG